MMSCYQNSRVVLPASTGFRFQGGNPLEELRSRLTDCSIGDRCSMERQSLSFCCVPTGCKGHLSADPDPGSLMRVVCSNPDCFAGKWMHLECFKEWEQLMEICVRSFDGRGGKNWMEVEERRQGLEMALTACTCICRRGYIRKDLEYYETKKSTEVMTTTPDQHHRKHPNTRLGRALIQTLPLRPLDSTRDGTRTGLSQGLSMASSRSNTSPGQVRVRTFSFSSTGSSPTSSNATPPPTSPRRPDSISASTPSSSPTPTPEVTTHPLMTASGNIFRHRRDLSAFRSLPKTIQNPYHIKVEDEGPHGNDRIRGFLMTNLTKNHATEVDCAVCHSALPVFDEFPLIDGTFFLSPRSYTDRPIQVVFDRRMLHLNAICLGCLEGSKTILRCSSCRTRWDGSTLILGTMYSYDVFAAMSCCSGRLNCTGCHRNIEDPVNLRFFSEFSRLVRCPHCDLEDYHFLKQLSEIFLIKSV